MIYDKMIYDKDNIPFVIVPSDPRFINLTGRIFARLTVLGYAGRKGGSYWFCECACGNIKKVGSSALKSGDTTSCGCLHRERMIAINLRHGETSRNGPSVEYTAFQNALLRCNSPNHPNYSDYGERGIEFRFETFNDFLATVGRRPTLQHSLERIDNKGHYTVGNVIWATKKEQSRNTRRNRVITYKGKTQCLAAWCEELGLNYKRVHSRLSKYRWSAERSFTVPFRLDQSPPS